ncbi:hypothetical protein C8T65DRAFT_675623, partial [Cerioporus squamosus]
MTPPHSAPHAHGCGSALTIMAVSASGEALTHKFYQVCFSTSGPIPAPPRDSALRPL